MADRLWAVVTRSNERPLCENPATLSRRLVVLPSFGQPRVLRIERTDAQWRLVWTQLGGRGGYELGEVVDHRERDVSGDDGDRVARQLGSLDALMRKRDGLGRKGTDGTVWLVESWSGERQHVAAAWSPRGQLEDVLRELLRAVDDECLDCD